MSDIMGVWVVGCVVAFVIGAVFGGVVLALEGCNGFPIVDLAGDMVHSGIGAVCLWAVGYPVSQIVIIALGQVFGGA